MNLNGQQFFDLQKQIIRLNKDTIAFSTEIQSIPSNLFENFGSFHILNIPSHITSIDSEAFSFAMTLRYISVDSQNQHFTSLDGVLFTKNMKTLICYPCSMTNPSYTIPAGVKYIADYGFSGASHLTSLVIPEGVVSIGKFAFSFAVELKSIHFPSTLESIDEYAFDNTFELEELVIDPANSFFTVIDGILYSKNQKTLISCPKGIELVNYIVPSTVVSICKHAFFYVESLQSITIPASVESIGPQAFSLSVNLNNISVDSNNEHYMSIEEVLFSKDMKTLIQYPPKKEGSAFSIPSGVTEIGISAFSCSILETISLPDGIISINDEAFSHSHNLDTINLPQTITSIGDKAFYFSKISSITFPDNVTKICKSACSDCNFLESIVFSKNLIEIHNCAFTSCTLLKEISIPRHVKSIADDAFSGCKSLEKISVDKNNSSFASIDGVLFSKDFQTIIIYPPNKIGGQYTIPSTVKVINSYAFFDCCNLTKIEIPLGVVSIGDYSISNCTQLAYIRIPPSVLSIGRSFSGCDCLKSVDIPFGVKSIGNYAFSCCDNLTSISISSSVTSIGDHIFSVTPKLTTVTIFGNSIENDLSNIISRLRLKDDVEVSFL